jgi:calcium permeable stress-gated cation channel
LCYFTLGYYVHKYQLLYSMDQPQHATGGAWRLICYRITLGLCIFQVVMLGILSLRGAFYGAALVFPLIIFTAWYTYYFNHRYAPLTIFIALRSIKRASDPSAEGNPAQDPSVQPNEMRLTRRMSTIDEDKEKGMRFVNPNLVRPLEQPWIYQDAPPPISPEESMSVPYTDDPENDAANERPTPRSENGFGNRSDTSSLSLGDTHIWRDNGDNNV